MTTPTPPQSQHKYPYTGPRPASPPDYDRVARVLSDADLEQEITDKKGEPEYQLALLREADMRARGGPPST